MLTIAALEAELAVPVIFTNANGIITTINQMFEKAYGWSKEELVGNLLTTIIPDGLHDAHQLGFARFLATGQSTILNQPIELSVVRSDGRKVPARHFIIAEKIDEEWVFGALITPIEDAGENT